MTLLKELIENPTPIIKEQWEKGDAYSYKEIKLTAKPKIAIQGPISYAAFIKEFSTQEAEDIKGFVKGTWYVTYTRTDFKTNDFNNNMKVFKDIKSANKYQKELKEKLGK